MEVPALNLQSGEEGLLDGVRLLAADYGFSLSDEGKPLRAVRTEERLLEVECGREEICIRYGERAHFFRGLGLLLERHGESSRPEEFRIAEQPQFSMNGAMFDASRNAVMTVDSIKRMLRTMAVMGLNTMMLYTEDTYEIKELPYFGYMRGRYSQAELKEIDDYASLFGIEVIPCIQTLAHLKQALQWNYASGIQDTDDILLVGEPQTYTFIENMVRAASAPFRSRRIHIGMDEAHQLGLGSYLDRNGFRNRFELMNEHLQRVTDMVRAMGLEPMIWSDMYFRLGSEHGWYYDLNVSVPEEVIKGMPAGVQFVYWDYYHDDPAFYEAYLDIHRTFGSEPVFAGGVWTWNGISPNYGKTILTTNAALQACKRKGIGEVFATLWGDNGGETDLWSGLLGLQLYAEHGFSPDIPDEQRLARRFRTCTGAEAEDFLALNGLDETPGVSAGNMKECNPSKFLLFQDVLIGLFDANIMGFERELAAHYDRLSGRLGNVSSKGWESLFGFYERLGSVLAVKAGIGVRLKAAYDEGDRGALRTVAEDALPDLIVRVGSLRAAHRKLWFESYKPFGWEVLDIRYGGLAARLETAVHRLNEYLSGETARIEELEEKRLLFDWQRSLEDTPIGRCHVHHRIVTAGEFTWPY